MQFGLLTYLFGRVTRFRLYAYVGVFAILWSGVAALDVGAKAFFAADSAYFTTNPNTADDKVVGFMANAGVIVTEPDIAAFRKATAPVVQAFKARVKSPLVDQALKEAGYQ